MSVSYREKSQFHFLPIDSLHTHTFFSITKQSRVRRTRLTYTNIVENTDVRTSREEIQMHALIKYAEKDFNSYNLNNTIRCASYNIYLTKQCRTLRKLNHENML